VIIFLRDFNCSSFKEVPLPSKPNGSGQQRSIEANDGKAEK